MQRFQRIERENKAADGNLQPYSWDDHLRIVEIDGHLAKMSLYSVEGTPFLAICFLEGCYTPRILTRGLDRQGQRNPLKCLRDANPVDPIET